MPIAVACCAVIAFACFLTPIVVMSPLRTQGAAEFRLALRLYRSGPVVALVCAVIALLLTVLGWRDPAAHRSLAISLGVTLISAALTRVNVYEIVFRPYRVPVFVKAETVELEHSAMVTSVTAGGESHAYPVGAMGYHHIVNDVVGGVPIVATYCTVCHIGIVWKRVVDGRTLTFGLAGIHDGNAILRDEQTESVWQQTNGAAIFGPMKGSQMELVHSDELSFGLWREEQPQGVVLKPVARFTWLYRNQGWEKFVELFPAVMNTSKTGMEAREIVFGISTASGSKAFPAAAVFAGGVIQDEVGNDPVLVLAGPDGLSVRAFRAPPDTAFRLDGGEIRDAETGSVWNFSGCAVSGERKGECLEPVDVVKEYWFDWQNYHPATAIFRI